MKKMRKNILKSRKAGSYDLSAKDWIRSRDCFDIKNADPKYIKQNRPHLFIEKPAMDEKIPDLRGRKVLCLGCGSGEEVMLLERHGATEIVRIDISKELIKHTKQNFPRYVFKVMDAEKITFDNESFDYVYSSLVLHYFKNWDKVLKNIFRILKKDGRFLFSTIHPVKWSSYKENDSSGKAVSVLMGFTLNHFGKTEKLLGDYHNIVRINEKWMNCLEVTMYSRSIQSMFQALIKAKFEVIDIVEPKAIIETKEYDKDYYLINQKIPNFIIFETIKNND